jgi:arylsulfatase A-like enzyme
MLPPCRRLSGGSRVWFHHRRRPELLRHTLIFLAIALPLVPLVQAQHLADKPNVLFLLADDLRADAIAAAGNQVIRTPHLDWLATRGQLFRRAVANNPVCVASRAEILTGCSSFRNGIFPGYSDRFNDELVTWPDAMRRSGYRTVFVGKWHIQGRPSQRGYEEVDGLFAEGADELPLNFPVDSNGRKVTGYVGWAFQTDDGRTLYPENGVGLTPDTDRTIADAAIRQIRKSDHRPFFIHVNLTAPHDPLIWPTGYRDAYWPNQMHVPRNFLTQHPIDNGDLRNRDELLLPFPRTEQDIRRELAIYYAVISHLDEQIGRIIAALETSGNLDRTFIIFSSDHGLAKGSHGLIGKLNMYEHTINVPMIILGPGLESRVERRAQVQLADLYPTVCDLVGIEIPSTVEARSFVPVLRGQTESIHGEVYGYVAGHQRMVRTDRYKLVDYPQIKKLQLFDLQIDPDELNDLSTNPVHATVLASLQRRLLQWQESVKDPALNKTAVLP